MDQTPQCCAGGEPAEMKPAGVVGGDVRTVFELVLAGQEGLVECRVIDTNKRVLQGMGYFDDPEALVRACAVWNGKANVYVGRNPRAVRLCPPADRNVLCLRKDAARGTDVDVVTLVSLDLDPVRPLDVPATDAEEAATIAMARQVAAEFRGSRVVASGNGAQVLLPVTPHRVAGQQGAFEARARAWEEGIRRAVLQAADGAVVVRVDSQYDVARIIKLPGLMSVKGTPSPHRPYRLARLLDGMGAGGRDALAEILAQRPVDVPGCGRESLITPAACIPPIFLKLLEHDTRLERTWKEQREDLKDRSRSGYDLSLASQLVRYGFTPEEILAVLLQSPSGRRHEGTPAYFARTIARARRTTQS